jgi:hypothetical protein
VRRAHPSRTGNRKTVAKASRTAFKEPKTELTD